MEGKIIVCEKAFIPWVKEYPFAETEEWGQALRASIPKTLEGILKGVPDNETFRKTIVKPLIVAVRKMLGNGFVSRQGLPKKLIMEIMKAKLKGEDAAKNYLQSINLGYQAFDQGELNSAMVARQRGQSFGTYRFREAIEKALGWLLPFIQPAKQGRFKSKLSNQVEHSGKLISDLAYDPPCLKLENEQINALINRYLRADIIPFTTGGASHCDFILIPESVTPADSTKVKEIKYKIYKHFLGQEQADKLRAIWIVIDESTKPDPNDYIGHPEKGAYFDMNLDIQVSKKD